MVSSYSIPDVSLYDGGVFMRYASLRAGDKHVKTFERSLDNKVDTKTLVNVEASAGTLINEHYLHVDLNTLRGMDNDEDLEKKVITRNTKFRERGHLNIFFLKIGVPVGDSITDDDLTYIVDGFLLSSANDIFVMPTLDLEGWGREEKIETYNSFVTKVLQKKSSNTVGTMNVGMMIPGFYPRKKIPDLFSLYDGENSAPSFVAVDFLNNRITDTRRMGIIPTINRHYSEEGDERFFLYGLNVRPHKRAIARPPAEDLALIECGFNAFGRPHSKPGSSHFVPNPKSWDHLGKVFCDDDYNYHPLSEADQRDGLCSWVQETYGKPFPNDFSEACKNATDRIRCHNFEAINDELFLLAENTRKNDRDFLKERLSSRQPPEEVAKGIAKLLSSRSPDTENEE